MNRIVWLLIAIALPIISFSKSDTGITTVSGTIKGLDSGEMTLIVRDTSEPNGFRREKIKVDKGSFRHSFSISETTLLTISPGIDRVVKRVKNGYLPTKSSLLVFFASPGTEVVFKGQISEYVDAYPSGTAANDQLAELFRLLNPLTNIAADLNVRKIALNEANDSLPSSLVDSINAIDNQIDKVKHDYLNAHHSSEAAAWLLSDMLLRRQISNEEAVSYYGAFDSSLSSSVFYQEVATRVEGIRKVHTGSVVPDIITKNTYDRKQFLLSSLRGKYVVLDFWGTWCMPCIAGMPKMKAYWQDHRDKLALVGIATESDNGNKWRSMISKRKWDWFQLLDNPEKDLVLSFNIAGYPSKIVVDPNGIIVGRFVGETDEMYTLLDKLLK